MITQIFFLGLLLSVSAKLISVEVSGFLRCENDPNSPITVELWEEDVFQDDLLKSTTTGKDQHYEVRGTEDEWFDIEPYLVIRHKCRGVNKLSHKPLQKSGVEVVTNTTRKAYMWKTTEPSKL
ncbi:Transthyretin-like family protein [Cooperia oncophora]